MAFLSWKKSKIVLLGLRGEIMPGSVQVVFFKAFDRFPHIFFCGEKQIVRVEPVRIDVAGGFDSCLLKTADIIDGFLLERFDIPDIGIAGRKTAEVLAPGRRGVVGNQVRAVHVAKVTFPRFVVSPGVPVRSVIVP